MLIQPTFLLVALAVAVQVPTGSFVTARLIDDFAKDVKGWTGDLSAHSGEAIHADIDVKQDDAVDEEDNCHAESLDSKPGQAWEHTYGWRFDTSNLEDPEERSKENRAKREQAYAELVKEQLPWPDWFEPQISILQAGTLFQMAMSSTQKDDRPGGFGTFDEIDTLTEVRDDLAVLEAWKPDVQRINVYRVTEVLPVKTGPVGPQVDPQACELLPGRFSQFKMLVLPWKRMDHLELVKSHIIKQE